MKTKPTFLYGLSEKKEFSHLSKYFNIPKIDWNKGIVTPKIKEKHILIGFSLGCIIACIHAEKTKVNTLVLCSPSPDETLKNIKANKVVFIFGEKEKWIAENVVRMAQTLKCKYDIYIVPNATHKITKTYLSLLLNIIKLN